MGRKAHSSQRGAVNALPYSAVVSKRGPSWAFRMQNRTAFAMRLVGLLPEIMVPQLAIVVDRLSAFPRQSLRQGKLLFSAIALEERPFTLVNEVSVFERNFHQ